MGVCTSIKKNKKIKVKQRNELKNENDINKNEENNKKDNKENKSSSNIYEDSRKNLDEEKKYKNKNSKIIINYCFNGKKEFQEVFNSNDNISSLFDILLFKKSKYSEYDLSTNEYLSLSSKLNEKIGKIFENMENIEVNMIYVGLDISHNIKLEYKHTNKVLGIPLFNLGGDVGLLIFHIIEKKFTKEIIKNNKLSKFNHLSSICNGKNFLYLSGGDTTKESEKSIPTNYFTSIDLLNTNSINDLPKLNVPRLRHSMIYIPKKYIYIVGGGTSETELYDIEKKSIIIDNKMKEIRNECTLFIMNNSILYAFCGISVDGSFISTVERCNLRQKERNWSYVNYSTADNTLFGECFYVASFFSDSSVLLFAANEKKNKFSNILFDLEDEENPYLRCYKSGGKIIDVIPEKIFHPIGQNISIMIPLIGTTAKIYKIDETLKLNIEYFPEVLKEIMQ